MEATNAVKIAN